MQQIARELAGFVSEVVYVYPEEGIPPSGFSLQSVKLRSAAMLRLLSCTIS